MKINYHTHSTFCDGKNTPEEIILAAIEKKFDILGFSGHSMFPFAETWHISPKEHLQYVNTINNLKEKYKNQIIIQLGFEVDYLPPLCSPKKENFKEFNPDFLIGSVHYIATKDGYYSVDDATENVKKGLNNLYNGNGKKAVCEYFDAEREMIEHGDFDILGHPDVIRKRNGSLNFFNQNESWYRKELIATAKKIAKKEIIVEINSGAIARKAMDDFYPSQEFLAILHDYNIPVMINSDAHSAEFLDCAFDRATALIKKIGYTEIAYPINGNIKFVKI